MPLTAAERRSCVRCRNRVVQPVGSSRSRCRSTSRSCRVGDASRIWTRLEHVGRALPQGSLLTASRGSSFGPAAAAGPARRISRARSPISSSIAGPTPPAHAAAASTSAAVDRLLTHPLARQRSRTGARRHGVGHARERRHDRRRRSPAAARDRGSGGVAVRRLLRSSPLGGEGGAGRCVRTGDDSRGARSACGQRERRRSPARAASAESATKDDATGRSGGSERRRWPVTIFSPACRPTCLDEDCVRRCSKPRTCGSSGSSPQGQASAAGLLVRPAAA